MKSNLHTRFRVITWLTAVAMFSLGTIQPASATLIYSNIGSSQDGSDAVYGAGPLADSFSTGSAGGALGGVQLLLSSLSSAFIGTLQVNLLSDGGTLPGATLASLGSLSFASVSTSQAVAYSFRPVSTVVLAPNTRYWVELMGASPNAIQWSWSDDVSGLGVVGQYTFSSAFGVNANSAAFGPYQMAVAIPEPASGALVAVGLGIAALWWPRSTGRWRNARKKTT